MVTVGLLIRLQARPGQETAVEAFLESAIPIVAQEPATTALFMIRFGHSEYGIFNAFPDEAGRQAHMTGHAAEGLFTRAGELFSEPPAVEPVEIIAAKLPG
jgi:quinol monooxygenase YgiN